MRFVQVLLFVASLVAVAHADAPVDRATAFEVDRLAPPIGEVELGFDSGAPINGWAVGTQLGYLDRPMRLHTQNIEIFPVNRRETLALGGSLVVGSVVLDLRMPMSHQTGDRLNQLADERPLDRWVLNDLGLGARVRLAVRERASMFARAQLTFGTGDDRDFAGEAGYTVAWMLIARFHLPGGVMVAGTGGVRFRRREVIVADRLLGDELFGGIGATYQLPAVPGLYCDANRVRATAEVVGVLGNDVANQRGPSPLEARMGVISRIRPWLGIAVRVGKGLDDHIGAPRFRAMLELSYEGGAR